MSENETTPDTSTTGVVRDSLHITSMAIVTLCVIAVAASAYVLKPVLIPVVLALLIAGAIEPVLHRIDRLGIPRPLTAGFFVGSFMALLLLAVWSFSTPIAAWVSSIPGELDRVDSALQELREPVEAVAEEVDELTEDAENIYEPSVKIEKDALSGIVGETALRTLSHFLLTIVILYFVIGFGHSIASKLRARTGHDLIGEIAASISTYLFKVTMINAGLGVCIGVAMWLVGMPYPQIWAVLAFAMNFLPYIGAIVGICLVAFVSTITFDSLAWTLLPPGVYLVLTSVEANFVTPTILGMGFPINPLVLFVWVLFCSWLWGFIGALIAVPVLMAIRLACTHSPRMEFIGDLIGDMPGAQRE